MHSKSFKSSGIRRLGLQPLAPNQQQPQQQQHPPPVQQAQQTQQPNRAPALSSRGSKAQALCAFRSLVEGSAIVRPSTAQAERQPAAAAGKGDTDPQQQLAGPAQPHAPAAPSAAAGSRPFANGNNQSAAPAHGIPAAPQPHVSTAGLAGKPQAQAAKVPPNQLIPKAAKALDKLQQQLSSRTLTYLYQFDTLLSTASSSCDALSTFLHRPSTATLGSSSGPSIGAGQHGLLQLLQDQQHAGGDTGAQSAAVLDLIVQLCMQIWEVEVQLLQHHHAAEPQNTTQQAGQFHEHARKLWEAWESLSLSQRTTTAAAGAEHGGLMMSSAAEGSAAPEDNWPLSEGLCAALAVMSEAAAAWANVDSTDQSDWCYQQLRKHLCSVAAAGDNDGLQLETRRALQRLQFSILTGNLSLAARQGQQAVWANLTTLVHQLLQQTAMETEETLSASLSMAGTLADTANTMLQANSSDSSSSSDSENKTQKNAHAGSSTTTAITLLEFAAQLLDYAKQQAFVLAPPQQQQQQHQGPDAGGPESLLQQVAGIQQQVLMQLAQAYLSTKQPTKVLDCISVMQGLSTGRTPPAGLLQLSSLALLQQGKVGAASAQLCAWLRQGGQGTEEACSAVRSFLVALHPQGIGIRTAPTRQGRHTGENSAAVPIAELQGPGKCSGEDRAAAVQQVAAAAAEHCRADPAVALEVVMQLLAEQGGGSAQLSLERLAVQLLSIEEVSQLLRTRQEDCHKCHTLLHDKGAAHYAAHNYSPAIDLLTPAVFFATSLTAGKSARLLAIALLKSGQPGRALDYVGLAEQQEGSVSATGCIIRLQAALQRQAKARIEARGQDSKMGAAAAAAAADEAVAAAQGPVLAAVKDMGSIQHLSKESFQTAFSLCMQHSNTAAAWQVLLAWRDAAVTTAAAPETAPTAAAAAAATAGEPALGHPTGLAAARQLRLLQVLSLMRHIAADITSSSRSSGSSGRGCHQRTVLEPPHLATQQLCDICDTFTRCVPSDRHTSQPNSSNRIAAEKAATHDSGSSISTVLTSAQLMWLVDTGLQLGVTAAQKGQVDMSVSVLRSVLAACSMLQSTGASTVAPAPAADYASAAAAGQAAATAVGAGVQGSGGVSSLGLQASNTLSSRIVAALTVAASILMQAKSGPDAAAAAAVPHRQLQQAEELLMAAQRQLQQHATLLLRSHSPQQQQGEGAPAEPSKASNAPVWSDAAAVDAAMQPLQLLIIRLSFAVAQRQGQEKQGKQLLQKLVEHPLAGPSDFKAAALECLQPGRPASYQATAALAYTHMLRLAVTEPADLPEVAEAVASLMTLSTSHRVKTKAVSKVVEVLGSAAAAATAAAAAAVARGCGGKIAMGAGAVSVYPAKNLQWLIATCWNSAVEASSTGDACTARQYLQLVSDLAATQQQQQQQQQQQHWLLGSKQFKQLWERLHGEQSESQGSEGKASQQQQRQQQRPKAQLQSGSQQVDTQDHGQQQRQQEEQQEGGEGKGCQTPTPAVAAAKAAGVAAEGADTAAAAAAAEAAGPALITAADAQAEGTGTAAASAAEASGLSDGQQPSQQQGPERSLAAGYQHAAALAAAPAAYDSDVPDAAAECGMAGQDAAAGLDTEMPDAAAGVDPGVADAAAESEVAVPHAASGVTNGMIDAAAANAAMPDAAGLLPDAVGAGADANMPDAQMPNAAGEHNAEMPDATAGTGCDMPNASADSEPHQADAAGDSASDMPDVVAATAEDTEATDGGSTGFVDAGLTAGKGSQLCCSQLGPALQQQQSCDDELDVRAGVRAGAGSHLRSQDCPASAPQQQSSDNGVNDASMGAMAGTQLGCVAMSDVEPAATAAAAGSADSAAGVAVAAMAGVGDFSAVDVADTVVAANAADTQEEAAAAAAATETACAGQAPTPPETAPQHSQATRSTAAADSAEKESEAQAASQHKGTCSRQQEAMQVSQANGTAARAGMGADAEIERTMGSQAPAKAVAAAAGADVGAAASEANRSRQVDSQQDSKQARHATEQPCMQADTGSAAMAEAVAAEASQGNQHSKLHSQARGQQGMSGPAATAAAAATGGKEASQGDQHSMQHSPTSGFQVMPSACDLSAAAADAAPVPALQRQQQQRQVSIPRLTPQTVRCDGEAPSASAAADAAGTQQTLSRSTQYGADSQQQQRMEAQFPAAGTQVTLSPGAGDHRQHQLQHMETQAPAAEAQQTTSSGAGDHSQQQHQHQQQQQQQMRTQGLQADMWATQLDFIMPAAASSAADGGGGDGILITDATQPDSDMCHTQETNGAQLISPAPAGAWSQELPSAGDQEASAQQEQKQEHQHAPPSSGTADGEADSPGHASPERQQQEKLFSQWGDSPDSGPPGLNLALSDDE